MMLGRQSSPLCQLSIAANLQVVTAERSWELAGSAGNAASVSVHPQGGQNPLADDLESFYKRSFKMEETKCLVLASLLYPHYKETCHFI